MPDGDARLQNGPVELMDHRDIETVHLSDGSPFGQWRTMGTDRRGSFENMLALREDGAVTAVFVSSANAIGVAAGNTLKRPAAARPGPPCFDWVSGMCA